MRPTQQSKVTRPLGSGSVIIQVSTRPADALGFWPLFMPINTVIGSNRMSALPPEADMCGATRDVRFGPIPDMYNLVDHLTGANKQRRLTHDWYHWSDRRRVST